MPWNSDESFPLAEGGWGAWRPPFGRKREGEPAVQRAISKWHPFDPVLVSTPGAERLLPPICIAEFAPSLHERTQKQYLGLVFLAGGMTLCFMIAGVMGADPYFVRGGIAFLLLWVFVLVQYGILFRKLDRLRGYSRFCSWCYMQPRSPVVFAGLAMVVVGGVQCWFQTRTGSLFGLIEQYGLAFDAARDEPWRYFTGPAMHAGIIHWTANFSMLILVVGLSTPVGRQMALLIVFLAGIFLPAVILGTLPHWIRSDAFLGVSGGVFALCGWLSGVALRRPRMFPFGFWWVLGYFSVASVAISSLLDVRASWFAHGFGLAIGLVLGTLCWGAKEEAALTRTFGHASSM